MLIVPSLREQVITEASAGNNRGAARFRVADLVILDANPIESTANLHAIHPVVRDGRYYSREDLADLRRRVAAGGGPTSGSAE